MRIVISLMIVCFSLNSFAGTKNLWKGLEKNLPTDFLEKNKFVSFQKEPNRVSPRAPIAAAILFNGVRIRSLNELKKVFTEDFLALIPTGTKILKSKNADGLNMWKYPIGTQVIHVIYLKSKEKDIFELRIVKKLAEKKWAFGVYIPGEKQLVLQTYQGLKPDSFTVHTTDNTKIDVSLKHIPLNVCQNCHFRTTSSPQLNEKVSDTGPCEFVPDNKSVPNTWIPNYLETHGENPFELAD